MTLTRAQLLRRGAAGVAALALPGWLGVEAAPAALADVPAWVHPGAMVSVPRHTKYLMMRGVWVMDGSSSDRTATLWRCPQAGCRCEVFTRNVVGGGTASCGLHGRHLVGTPCKYPAVAATTGMHLSFTDTSISHS